MFWLCLIVTTIQISVITIGYAKLMLIRFGLNTNELFTKFSYPTFDKMNNVQDKHEPTIVITIEAKLTIFLIFKIEKKVTIPKIN